MSAEHEVRAPRLLVSRPLGAIAVSLATVLCFTAVLGLIFLPAEVRHLVGNAKLGIVSCHFLEGGTRAIVLTRTTGTELQAGFSRQVVLHDLSGAQPPRVLISTAFQPLSMIVSADHRWLFSVGMKGQIHAIDLHAPDRQPRLLGKHRCESMRDLRCTADGSLVVSRGSSCLCAWDTTQQRLLWGRDDLRVDCWALAPRLRRCLVHTDDGALVELDLQSGRTLRSVRNHPAARYGAAFSSDARLIALMGPGGELEVVDFATGESIWPVTAAPRLACHAPTTMAFSPCGRFLITTARHDLTSLTIWSVETGERLGELGGHDGPVTGIAFTQDGKLHSWGLDGTIRTWDCWTKTGTRGVVLGKRPQSCEPGPGKDVASLRSAKKEEANPFSITCASTRAGVGVHE